MWLRVAIFCGAAPLLAGVTLCGLFLAVAEDWSYESAWVSAGLVVIFSGLALFGLGLVALCAYFFKGRKAGLETRKLVEKRIWPAIDIAASGTRREELLLDPKEAKHQQFLHIREKLYLFFVMILHVLQPLYMFHIHLLL